MAQSQLKPLPYSDRPADHTDRSERVWRWVILSGFAHVAVIVFLLVTPFIPRKAPSAPVYTVDLVGGEKLGGGAGTAPLPAPKAAPAPEVKETKTSVPDAKAEMTERLAKAKAKKEAEAEKLAQAKAKKEAEALAKAKREAEAAEKAAQLKAKQEAEMAERIAKAKREEEERIAKVRREEEERKAAEQAQVEKVRQKLDELRRKRIEEDIAQRRTAIEEKQRHQQLAAQQQQETQRRQEEAQRLQAQKGGPATSTVAGREPGAATFTAGGTGTGGGIVKSPEYIRYYNEMRARIKNSWTWPGRRADLKVTVTFSVQDNGEINGLRIVHSSGDRSYDESVVRAVRKASPFPPLPTTLREELRNWEWDFAPKDLAS